MTYTYRWRKWKDANTPETWMYVMTGEGSPEYSLKGIEGPFHRVEFQRIDIEQFCRSGYRDLGDYLDIFSKTDAIRGMTYLYNDETVKWSEGVDVFFAYKG